MDDAKRSLPPENITGICRRNRGRAPVKPKNMKGTLVRLWKITKGKRQGLILILFLSALISASAVFSPFIIGRIVNLIVKRDPITFMLIMLCLLYIMNWLVRFLQQYLMASLSQRIIKHIRVVLFDHVKDLPLAFFDRKQHGELMSRLTNDVDNISVTISNSMSMLLTYIFTIGGIFVMMLRLSILLTLVSLTGIFLIFILTKVVTDITRKLFAKQQKELGALNGHVEESISGISEVKAYGREAMMEEAFDMKNESMTEVSIDALIHSGYLMPMTNVINNLSYLTISVFSALMLINGKLEDVGMITSFLLYVRQFTRPFVDIANIYNNFQTAVAGAERVFEIIDEKPEPPDIPSAKEARNIRGDIELRDVSFGYDEKMVLKDVSVRIPAGTKVAIVGPTGSGKTTIINLLTRFYDVTEGQILLDGTDIREYTLESLRDCFGVVLQDTSLFVSSVKDNIRYGNTWATDEDVREAARIAGADSMIERIPDGYDTLLTQGGNELSQGERQLITIARAVLSRASILILDEATSSVDTVTEQKIRQAMLKLCEGRTSFIIAHRLTTIRDSDMILFVEDGRIVEKGTHRELMDLGGRYARMYLTQSGYHINKDG